MGLRMEKIVEDTSKDVLRSVRFFSIFCSEKGRLFYVVQQS